MRASDDRDLLCPGCGKAVDAEDAVMCATVNAFEEYPLECACGASLVIHTHVRVWVEHAPDALSDATPDPLQNAVQEAP